MSLGSAGFRCAFYLVVRYPKILCLKYGMGSRKLGAEQVEAGSQGPTAQERWDNAQGILN